MSNLGEELKGVQDLLLAEHVKLKARYEALLEILDAFNIIDIQLVEDRAECIEEEVLHELISGVDIDEEDEESDGEPWTGDSIRNSRGH